MTNERREELLRATTRQLGHQDITGDDAAAFWDMDPLTSEELRGLLDVRSCATCRHVKLLFKQGYDPLVCVAEWPGRPGRAAPTFDRRVTEDYSCVFWEPLAPETKGEMTK
jgi:hypothetical protein